MGKRRGSLITVFLLALVLIATYGNFGPPAAKSGVLFLKGKKEVSDCYIGGFPVAMVLKVDGVIVEAGGEAYGLAPGDVIKGIDGQRVVYGNDIDAIMAAHNGENADLIIKRNDVEQTVSLPVEIKNGKKKLNLNVRDTVAGIGMITFVKADGSFGALGHKISDPLLNDFDFIDGTVYRCRILGLKRGAKGMPGEIRGCIAGLPIGKIFRNTRCGVFGKFFEIAELPLEKTTMAEASQTAPGKAYVLTTLNEEKKSYEVEIIKPFALGRKEKGMVIRVTDKDLLAQAGGIIQGMSGSPIIQNGKLIGAVTHVFVNDPAKGYGIYASLMNDLADF